MKNLTEHIDAIEKERNELALELARSVIARREDARAADIEQTRMREQIRVGLLGSNKYWRDAEATQGLLDRERAALNTTIELLHRTEAERDALAMLIDMRARYTYLGTKGLMSSQTITVLLSTGDTFLSAVLEAAEGATSMSDAELRMRIDLRKSGPFWHMDQQTRSDLLKRFARTE